MRLACAASIAVLLGGPLTAAEKVYEGAEAAALHCANIVAFTGVSLNDAGKISDLEKEVMLGISFLMLEGHVSGKWRQKRAALEIVRERHSPQETLADFERLAQKCLRQFPIN